MAKHLDFPTVSFLDHFSQLEDPRIDRKKLYPLNEILLVTLCATICGAESWRDFELFGNQKIGFLRRFLPFENGIPSHDTFGRVYSLTGPRVFGRYFISWVESLQKALPKMISFAGKRIRRSFDQASGKAAIHMVSAFASESRLALGQVKVTDKSNEITAIPTLLELLSIKGAIVTIDAMGCQKAIVEKIIEKKADYVLGLKKNHKDFYEQIDTFFKEERKNNFKDIACDYYEEIDKGHGRIEIRKCWTTKSINWIEGIKDWSRIKTIAMI